MPRIFGYQITSADVLKGPLTLLDNQGSPVNLISYNATSIKYIQLQYGIVRNGIYLTGHVVVTTDGSAITSISDSNTQTAGAGVSFQANIVGSTLFIQYMTSPTGFPATMTYYEKAWQ